VTGEAPVLRIGIVGLGGAAMQMLPSLLHDPRIRITAVADVDDEARRCFAADFGVTGYGRMEDICGDGNVDAVYVATPHAAHTPQAIVAAEPKKHVLVEKPLALSVADCLAIAAAARTNGVHVVVGHTHAFDPPVLAMWQLLRTGTLGRVVMVNTWNYGAFLYRPGRPEELDTARGGGIIFNQVPHQVDMARLLGGEVVGSVRSAAWILDPSRPTEGSHATFLELADGAAATLVYSGYDYFDSDELHAWTGEMGEPRRPAARARPAVPCRACRATRPPPSGAAATPPGGGRRRRRRRGAANPTSVSSSSAANAVTSVRHRPVRRLRRSRRPGGGAAGRRPLR
jgi:phthalate 4,5-cis-dihydrodiol dehydrogenase